MVGSSAILANDFTVKVEPHNPVAAETFTLKFILNVEDDSEDPFITFDPGRIQVIGRSGPEYFSQYTIINGKMSQTKTLTYTYEMVVDKAGSYTIKGIKATLGKNVMVHKDLPLKIVSEPLAPKDFFAKAEVSKSRVYVGEPVHVTYYIYSQANNLRDVAIITFPKFRNFLKRTRVNENRAETVEENGNVYVRRAFYEAIVFADKSGELKIDPIAFKIAYSKAADNVGFWGLGRVYEKTVTSKDVLLDVMPLPSENVPKDFIGLVGRPEVSVDMPRNKFLVNDAIELKIIVSGTGALEKLSPFQIYQNEFIESFDTKESFDDKAYDHARKVFEYTFLGRKSLQIPESTIGYSYFDPQTHSYVQESFLLPELIVQGGQAIPERQQDNLSTNPATEENQKNDNKIIPNLQVQTGMISPLFIYERNWSSFSWEIINGMLLFFILLTITLMFKEHLVLSVVDDNFSNDYLMVKSKFNYSNLVKFLSNFKRNERDGISETISLMNIDDDHKNYFKTLILSMEKNSFGGQNIQNVGKFDKKKFKRLYKYYYEENSKHS